MASQLGALPVARQLIKHSEVGLSEEALIAAEVVDFVLSM